MLVQRNDGPWRSAFNRSCAQFKEGFGSKTGNYWIGNQKLHEKTKNGDYKLKFDLQPSDSSNLYYAKYSEFKVLSENDKYKVEVGGYSGTAGYDAFGWHNNYPFSTYDKDNDFSEGNCAVRWHAGFWYNRCYYVGVNNNGSWMWWSYLEESSNLQKSRMWLEPKHCQ